jgi:glutathione peroxidase
MLRIALLVLFLTAFAAAEPTTQPTSPLDFTMKTIDGADKNLADYRGQVVMIVNVASRCGNTPQYATLESLYRKHKDEGFTIIGFPANNFGNQEPGTEADIKKFCSSKYDVTFPMMAKISVKGDNKHPLCRYLTEAPTAGAFKGEIEWNFAKFLIGRSGQVIARFPAGTKPDDPKVPQALDGALAMR